MNVLVVVAHPDDEVLGCGGTVAELAASGVDVRTCILSGCARARSKPVDPATLRDDIRSAHAVLGIRDQFLGDFPNIQFNVVPHLDIVKFIETAIVETSADVVFTHSPGDLNDDHRQTSRACQAAVRIAQRRPGLRPLRALYFMEILSSTDWSFRGDGGPCFAPDAFFELGEQLLMKKIQALRCYQGVMREFPHPRSEEVIRALAAYRGGQAGVKYAEAFQTAFSLLSTFIQV
jgi:LmbE family N-acetylglucosaminyl deacetylase